MDATYVACVPRPDRARVGIRTTAGERNVRVPVAEPVHEAPDPIREGATPSRQSRVQVVTYAYDMGQAFGTEDFIMGNPDYRPGAWSPYGRQASWDERANIAPPQHVAYGSLFQYDPYVYGY